MIPNRRHLEGAIAAERERANLLFGIAVMIGLYTYRELERRQKLREKDDKDRVVYEDSEFQRCRTAEQGHKERSATVNRLFAVGATLVTIVTGIALLYATLVGSGVLKK